VTSEPSSQACTSARGSPAATGDDLDARGRHALARPAAHATDEGNVHALLAQPRPPAARLGIGRHGDRRAHDGARRPIDLMETDLGGSAEVRGERTILVEW
jgi:hypothetical protein